MGVGELLFNCEIKNHNDFYSPIRIANVINYVNDFAGMKKRQEP
jgi:hypothetical protein